MKASETLACISVKSIIPLFLWASLAAAQTPAYDDLNLIPQPARFRALSGKFVFSEETILLAAAAFTNEAALLRRQLQTATGLQLRVLTETAKAPRNSI